MNRTDKTLGITIVLLKHLNQILPDSLWIKNRVDKGELLNDDDIAFLNETLNDAHIIKNLIVSQPEWQPLFVDAVHLYQGITAKALENQQTK